LPKFPIKCFTLTASTTTATPSACLGTTTERLELISSLSTPTKKMLFGEVVGGVVKLSPVGEIVQEQWLQIPTDGS